MLSLFTCMQDVLHGLLVLNVLQWHLKQIKTRTLTTCSLPGSRNYVYSLGLMFMVPFPLCLNILFSVLDDTYCSRYYVLSKCTTSRLVAKYGFYVELVDKFRFFSFRGSIMTFFL